MNFPIFYGNLPGEEMALLFPYPDTAPAVDMSLSVNVKLVIT
jgi:hypothetical protein